MAFSQSSSSCDYTDSSTSSFDEDNQSDSYDDELEDEELSPDSHESATLAGSDTEYRYESEPDSEANSAKKSKTKTKINTNTNVEAKSKKKSPSSTAVANEKRPREKPETKGGDASNKKRKKAENETNLQTGDDAADAAMEKDKEMMMKKKKNKSRSPSSAAAAVRVWSQRDELIVLKGIISFLKKFGTFDGKKFNNWINKYIEADVSTAQISDKVCRLKKKYRKNNEENRGPNGEDPVFSKPHEQKLFDLSKQAWWNISSTTNHNNTNADINDGIVEEGADAQKKATDDAVDDDAADYNLQEKEDAADHKLQEKEEDGDGKLFDDNLVVEAFDKYLTSRGIDLRWLGQEKLESLENKWRKIRVAESTFRLLQAKFDAKVHQIALHAYNFFDY